VHKTRPAKQGEEKERQAEAERIKHCPVHRHSQALTIATDYSRVWSLQLKAEEFNVQVLYVSF
jgi:hypothetical protein